MHKTVLLLLVAVALAGCSADEPEAPAEIPAEATTVTLSGIVQDRNVVPLEGAAVSIRDSNLTFITGIDGRFAFPDLESGFYILDATAPDHDTVTLTHRPGDVPELLFVLTRITIDPYQDTQHFQGIVECAAEYLIITPSCDTITEYVAEQGVPLPGGASARAASRSAQRAIQLVRRGGPVKLFRSNQRGRPGGVAKGSMAMTSR